jgi:hypothetical protein
VLDEDLRAAALAALAIDREGCRRAAAAWTWESATAQFFSHLVRARRPGPRVRRARSRQRPRTCYELAVMQLSCAPSMIRGFVPGRSR